MPQVDSSTAGPEDEFLNPGATFHGRYQVVRLLKAGGMGAVYEVHDRETGRRRALKTMLRSLATDTEMRLRFRLEATVAARIESEHIVDVFDAGVDDASGQPFLVMELLRGESLAAALSRRGRLRPEETVTFLHQASLALDRTHSAGIVHRDLKPENLFLTLRDDSTPRVKLLDFGIAKIVAETTHASTTRSLGTPLYMSPEQIRGDGNIGPRADVYSLGQLAFTMLVGRPYWEPESQQGGGAYGLLLKVMEGAAEPATARAARSGVDLPGALDAWYRRATALHPSDRFDRASELVEELADALLIPRPSPGFLGAGPPAAPAVGGEMVARPTIDGKYQILKELGEGGMGTVYEALHLGTGRRVAVKVIRPDALTGGEAVARFQREARASGAVDSPNVVQVFDIGSDGGRPYIVMELLSGEDLAHLIARAGMVAPDLALRIAAQACLGLGRAHTAGIIHRDIKSANIFLTKQGDNVVVKILDFGIAKVRSDALGPLLDSGGLTQAGAILGSPSYMSPEQVKGGKSLDARSDVWSLGVVLHEALSGTTPHAHIDTMGALIVAICSEVPATVQHRAPWVSRDVAAIVERALALDPSRRFQSAEEMHAAIAKLLPGGAHIHESELVPLARELRTRAGRDKKPARRWLVPAAGAAIAVAAIGGYLGRPSSTRSAPASPPALVAPIPEPVVTLIDPAHRATDLAQAAMATEAGPPPRVDGTAFRRPPRPPERPSPAPPPPARSPPQAAVHSPGQPPAAQASGSPAIDRSF